MVQAILEGRKSQTRRVAKPQPTHFNPAGTPRRADPDGPSAYIYCPYGKPGDRLWVREAWRVAECYDSQSGADLAGMLSARNVQYEVASEQFLGQVAGRYRHARFMPRWASRITLEITAVRVERLNDITVADAVAEGALVQREVDQFARVHAISMFSAIWQGIHGPGSWAANPWVWVVEFQRVKP